MTDKTTITKEQLNTFIVAGKYYLNDREESELTKAIESILPEAINKLKKVERQRDMFRISLAKKTASKHIELDKNGRHQYTEDDTKKIWDKMDEIDKEEIQIHACIVTEYPTEDISYDMKRAFSGIVIPELNIPKFEEEPVESEE